MGGSAFALEGGDGLRVVVDGGRVVAPETAVDAVFRVSGARLRPGLINAHDHLSVNHYPRLGEPPYPNLYAWARDVHGRFGAEVARCRALPRSRALLFGALKNLLGGVTRVVHHDPWSAELEALPVRVEPVRVIHSLGLVPEGGRPAGDDRRDRRRHGSGGAPGDPLPPGRPAPPLCMHLAEGTDETAAGEVAEADRRGLLGPDLLAVHLLGATDADGARLRGAGVGFVWCPSSSLHLYGRAAAPAPFAAGLDLLLGTDSLLSGAGTLLHELEAARREGHASDAALEAAVGRVPARRLGLAEPALEPGAPADLVALRVPLPDARPADVALVMVGGLPRYADAGLDPLFRRTGVAAERLEVGGRDKLVAAPLGAVAGEVFRLTPECLRILA